VPVRVLTVFTHPAAQLELDDGSVPALMIGKLRKQVASQGTRLPQAVYDDLAACLERVTVT
ncbi:MAG TPA: hypothetical protein VFH29_00855, partial [Anaerolineales bacterium]|nr:hypothetical protein [Anaerolineales bacterium]